MRWDPAWIKPGHNDASFAVSHLLSQAGANTFAELSIIFKDKGFFVVNSAVNELSHRTGVPQHYDGRGTLVMVTVECGPFFPLEGGRPKGLEKPKASLCFYAAPDTAAQLIRQLENVRESSSQPLLRGRSASELFSTTAAAASSDGTSQPSAMDSLFSQLAKLIHVELSPAIQSAFHDRATVRANGLQKLLTLFRRLSALLRHVVHGMDDLPDVVRHGLLHVVRRLTAASGIIYNQLRQLLTRLEAVKDPDAAPSHMLSDLHQYRWECIMLQKKYQVFLLALEGGLQFASAPLPTSKDEVMRQEIKGLLDNFAKPRGRNSSMHLWASQATQADADFRTRTELILDAVTSGTDGTWSREDKARAAVSRVASAYHGWQSTVRMVLERAESFDGDTFTLDALIPAYACILSAALLNAVLVAVQLRPDVFRGCKRREHRFHETNPFAQLLDEAHEEPNASDTDSDDDHEEYDEEEDNSLGEDELETKVTAASEHAVADAGQGLAADAGAGTGVNAAAQQRHLYDSYPQRPSSSASPMPMSDSQSSARPPRDSMDSNFSSAVRRSSSQLSGSRAGSVRRSGSSRSRRRDDMDLHLIQRFVPLGQHEDIVSELVKRSDAGPILMNIRLHDTLQHRLPELEKCSQALVDDQPVTTGYVARGIRTCNELAKLLLTVSVPTARESDWYRWNLEFRKAVREANATLADLEARQVRHVQVQDPVTQCCLEAILKPAELATKLNEEIHAQYEALKAQPKQPNARSPGVDTRVGRTNSFFAMDASPGMGMGERRQQAAPSMTLGNLHEDEAVETEEARLARIADSVSAQYVDMEGTSHPDEVLYFEAERDQQPVLKAATLTQWVQRVTFDKYIDPMLQKTLVVTFPLFTTAQALLTHLVERFEAHLPRPDMSGDEQKVAFCVRSRVLVCLRAWLQYNGDFFQDVTLEDRLRRFMQNQEAHMDPQQRDAVLKLLAQRVENLASVELRRPSRARPSVSRNVARTLAAQSYHDISLTDLKPMAIAEQLTLWMWRSYARVRPTELLMKERGERTPHINSMTIKTEKVTHWALGMVLMTRDPTQRMRNYKFLIRLADALLQLGNFELAKGVAVAVDHTLVVRVIDQFKFARKHPKSSEILSSIQKIAIDKGPHLLERLQNRHCEQLPCIPPLFVYMRNRVICEEKANAKRPEYMPEGMLFVHKYRMICEHVRDALKFQQYEYVIEPFSIIQEYLDTRLMPNMTSELAESKFEEWNRLSYELVPSKRGSKAISGSIDGASPA